IRAVASPFQRTSVTSSAQTYVRSTTPPASPVRLDVMDDEGAGQLPLGDALERVKAAHARSAGRAINHTHPAPESPSLAPEIVSAEVAEVGYAARLFAQLSLPYLLVTWMATEAVRTKERTLVLGGSLNSFLRVLGLHRKGGPRGDISRLR